MLTAASLLFYKPRIRLTAVVYRCNISAWGCEVHAPLCVFVLDMQEKEEAHRQIFATFATSAVEMRSGVFSSISLQLLS